MNEITGKSGIILYHTEDGKTNWDRGNLPGGDKAFDSKYQEWEKRDRPKWKVF